MDVDKVAALRSAIVAEAHSWLNTPYVDCGKVKGLKGAVDCAMLLIAIYQNVGILPADYDPRPYSPDWHIHQDATLYQNGLQRWTKPVHVAYAGDVAMYKFGRHASHGAVVVGEHYIIHAHKRNGVVELCEKRTMAPWFDSYWSPFV